jgi:ribosomal protein S18 acetylase RimI-like enzyme
MTLELRPLKKNDPETISDAFSSIGWNKPINQYERYLAEQNEEMRIIIVATFDSRFAGYVTILWQSNYPMFRKLGIPEVQDLNVLPDFRQRRIGTALMDEAERIILQRSKIAGIGVGLHSDYGSAQRMYVRRGYIPDGQGMFFGPSVVHYGKQVVVDDSLNLYFTKTLA